VSWELHPRLAADAVEVGSLPLCRVLLMDDRTIPWVILVPEREGARELPDLSPADRAQLVEEAALVSRALRGLHRPDRINLGALGNLVPQFHLHVVARFAHDRAWPGPVWGAPGGERYTAPLRGEEVRRLRDALFPEAGFHPAPEVVESG
jgi:diadenosine tetraphosphate (Ap4A) HIT family hydrolase